MNTDRKIIEIFYNELSPLVKDTVDSAVNSIVKATTATIRRWILTCIIDLIPFT